MKRVSTMIWRLGPQLALLAQNWLGIGSVLVIRGLAPGRAAMSFSPKTNNCAVFCLLDLFSIWKTVGNTFCIASGLVTKHY